MLNIYHLLILFRLDQNLSNQHLEYIIQPKRVNPTQMVTDLQNDNHLQTYLGIPIDLQASTISIAKSLHEPIRSLSVLLAGHAGPVCLLVYLTRS